MSGSYFCPCWKKRAVPLEHKTLGRVCPHCLRQASPYAVPDRPGWWRGLLPSRNQQYYRDLFGPPAANRRKKQRVGKVADRDGWVCQLCGEPVDPEGRGTHRPSADHIVRVRDGGTSALGNLRLAHQSCNEHREGSRTAPFAQPLDFDEEHDS